MTAPAPGGDRVKSAETLFAIVDQLRELDGARVSELAERLDVAKSTVHRHLTTLLANEYAVKEGDEYRLGLRLLGLGEYVRDQNTIYHSARPLVEDLARETEERSLFMVEEHGRAVYLYRGIGSHAVRTNSKVGTRRYLHTIAGGKAMLAHLPDARVREIVDRWGLPAQTEHTITDVDELSSELATIRDRGVAFNDEECIYGLKAVAVPVLGPDGAVVGALSVSGPAHRMKGDWFSEDAPDLLLGTANELELAIKYAD